MKFQPARSATRAGAVRRLRIRLVAIAVTAAAVLGLGGAPAHAATSTLTVCGIRTTSTSLSGFGDTAQYFPAPSGTFELGALGWWTTNAQVVSAQEPWSVAGRGSRALQLNPGGTAQSSLDCNTKGENAARFFYRSPGLAGSQLHVTVETLGAAGALSSQNYTISGGSTAWALSPSIAIPNGRLLSLQFVRFTFATTGPGSWQLDDLLVDPWKAL